MRDLLDEANEALQRYQHILDQALSLGEPDDEAVEQLRHDLMAARMSFMALLQPLLEKSAEDGLAIRLVTDEQ